MKGSAILTPEKSLAAKYISSSGRSPNSARISPRNKLPGRRANHLCTAMIGR
jgi:hypothetical protein